MPDIWYQVRKKVGDIRNTLPQDIVGPGFNDEFGDTYGIVYGFTADGFTHRELRDHVGGVGQMHIDNIAEPVSSLQPRLLGVLACISEGMSNSQIAKALGYKNARTVSTLVYEIYKKLGLEKLSSRTEKRQLASNAFREANTGIVRIRISPFRDVMSGAQTITLNPDTADRVSSLLRQGYEVDQLEMIFRKPPPVSR